MARKKEDNKIRQELESGLSDKCPPHKPIFQINRKGEQFHECERCGAFLGWG